MSYLIIVKLLQYLMTSLCGSSVYSPVTLIVLQKKRKTRMRKHLNQIFTPSRTSNGNDGNNSCRPEFLDLQRVVLWAGLLLLGV